ncbi:MAG: hypothetical protein AABY16_01235 [Nanoarchaeota archaeon]
MNRQGHIGTIALVFGALFLVGFALYSFYWFSENANVRRLQLRQIGFEAVDGEKIVKDALVEAVNNAITFSKDATDFKTVFENKLKELAQTKRGQEVFGNVFSTIADGRYTLELVGDNYVLVINDLFYKVSVDKNEAVNNFNLRVVFNKSGVVSAE